MVESGLTLSLFRKGTALPESTAPIFDEARLAIGDRADGPTMLEEIGRAQKGAYDSMLFIRGEEPVGLICCESVDDDARLTFGHVLRSFSSKKAAVFNMAVDALVDKQFKVIRSNLTWPEPEGFSETAVAMGFVVVDRLSMVIEGDPGRTTGPLPHGTEIVRWSPEYFDDVARTMCETADPMDRVVYPQYQTHEGCKAMLRNILENKYGEFLPRQSFIALSGGRFAGYLLSILLPDGTILIVDIAVDPAFRRSGIGGAMIDSIVGGSDKKRIYLAVTTSNREAESLYRSKGFRVETAVRQHILAPGRGK